MQQRQLQHNRSYTMTKARAGFSLIELLVIIAIAGIIFSLITVAWKSYYQKLQFSNATQIFVQELYRTRSDARRSSDNITLSWDATNKTLQTSNSSSEVLRTKSLPLNKLNITTGSGTITYLAPFGRVLESTDQYIRLDDGNGNIRDILIIGVTGKIYQRSM